MNVSAMFLVEHYPEKPLIAGSFVAISAALGMFIGGAVAALIQNSLLSWRSSFAIVGIISLWVCRLRKQLCESPEFQSNQTTLSPFWLTHWRGLAIVAAVGKAPLLLFLLQPLRKQKVNNNIALKSCEII